MRQLFIFLILIIFISFSNCTVPSEKGNDKMTETAKKPERDSADLLFQYWQLVDAENPTSKDVAFTDDKGIQFHSGIIFMNDSTVLENPAGEMSYGKFSLHGNSIRVYFDNGRKAIYKIDGLNKTELTLARTENNKTSQLTYKATDTHWKNPEKNPFAKANYQWSQKPDKPENDEAIKKRLKDYVLFYAYYFHGFADGGASKINFEGLPNALKFYTGGIFVQKESALDKKWINSFYSTEDAFKARQILQESLTKKYQWDSTQSNWVKQTAPVLQQISEGL